jgi:membrane protein implicated in regulation of membrane protease activity
VGALLTLLLLGTAGILVFGLVMTLIGVALSVAFSLAAVLLLKLAPLLLLGWIVVKLVERRRRTRNPYLISEADRRWLDA